MSEQYTAMKLRKVAAAAIGWSSAGLLGLSVGGMFLAPELAV
jgi:hypothetical protein